MLVVPMKVREKVVIAASIVACCIAIAAFAMVSPSHFISTPKKSPVPVLADFYNSTVVHVSELKLEPIPLIATEPAPVTEKPKTPTVAVAGDKTKKQSYAISDRKRLDTSDSERFRETIDAFYEYYKRYEQESKEIDRRR